VIRALLAVIASIALAFVTIALLQPIGLALFAADGVTDPGTDARDLAATIEAMPAGALGAILATWALGTFTGAWLAARIMGRSFYGLLVGGVLMLAGLSKVIGMPYPWWFILISIILFLPAAYAGARLATPGGE
jgi:hypothetical protein